MQGYVFDNALSVCIGWREHDTRFLADHSKLDLYKPEDPSMTKPKTKRRSSSRLQPGEVLGAAGGYVRQMMGRRNSESGSPPASRSGSPYTSRPPTAFRSEICPTIA